MKTIGSRGTRFSDKHTSEMLVHGESSAKRPKTSGLGRIQTKVAWSLYGVSSFENSWLIILFCIFCATQYTLYIYIHMNMCVLCYPINQSINQSINQASKQASKQGKNQSINQSTNQSINQSINQYIYIYNYIHIPGMKWDCPGFQCAGAGCWWTPLMKTGAWRTKWVWVKMEGLWPMEPQMLDIYIYIYCIYIYCIYIYIFIVYIIYSVYIYIVYV